MLQLFKTQHVTIPILHIHVSIPNTPMLQLFKTQQQALCWVCKFFHWLTVGLILIYLSSDLLNVYEVNQSLQIKSFIILTVIRRSV